MATIVERRSAKWGVRYTVKARVRGYAPRVHTFNTRAEARDWGERQEQELRELKKSQGTSHDFSNYTLNELIREYLKEPKTKALRSYDDVERRLLWFADHHGTTKVLDVNARTLRSWRNELMTENWKPATVNRRMSVLRAAWRFGIAAELVPAHKQWPSKLMLPEAGFRERFLTHEEMRRLLKLAESDPVMRAMLMVSIGTGLRQGELLRLKWADIDLNKQTLTVHLSKSGRRRSVHIPANAVEALRNLKRMLLVSPTDVFLHADGRPMTASLLEARWRPLRRAAGLAGFRWHDLRHTCASLLAQNHATLLEIGSVLGHSTPAMTMRYAHLVTAAPVTGAHKLNELLGKAKRKGGDATAI